MLRIHRSHLVQRNPHCHYCGRQVRPKTSTLDHITPRGQGGTDVPENLVLACRRCNQAKGNRTLLEWAADILCGAEADVWGPALFARLGRRYFPWPGFVEAIFEENQIRLPRNSGFDSARPLKTRLRVSG